MAKETKKQTVKAEVAPAGMPIKIGISSKDRELISEGLSRLLAAPTPCT